MRFYSNYVLKKKIVRKNGTSPICVRITYNKNRVEISTGISTKAENWDEVRQLINEESETAFTYNT